MIYQFPYDVAYLARTRLSYINLPALLSDGKRDRLARIPGYAAIHLGETCYLIFVREGNPFHAALVRPGRREGVTIEEVLEVVGEEIEHGENGYIGYYGATEAQLRTMLSTLLGPPHSPPEGVRLDSAQELFPYLQERSFEGVVELSGASGVQYLCFRGGRYQSGYFSGKGEGVAAWAYIQTLFAAAERPSVALYPLLDELPQQAPVALVELYRGLIEGTMRELGEVLGPERAMELMSRSQERARSRHPILASFPVGAGGIRKERVVVSASELAEGVAAWLTEVLGDASGEGGMDPSEVVERAGRDGRFVLSEQGFFRRLPWPVAL